MKRNFLLIVALASAFVASAVEVRYTVKGDGSDDTSTNAMNFAAKPKTLYGVSCQVRHPAGKDNGGVAVVRTFGCNFYQNIKGNDWMPMKHVIYSPDSVKSGSCSVRQWHIPDVTEFSPIEVFEVKPFYRKIDDLSLGFGESVDGDQYHFGINLRDKNHGHSRALKSYRQLNLDSATQFTKGSEMVFEHSLGSRDFTAGFMSIVSRGDGNGRLVAEVSTDGTNWTEVVSVTNATVSRLPIAAKVFPAKRLYARVRGVGDKCSLKLASYAFDATFSGAPAFGFGATDYLKVDGGEKMISFEPKSYLSDVTSGELLPGTPAGVAAWEQSSGRKVFRGRPVPSARASAFKISAARNEAEAKQLVLNAEKGLQGAKVSAEIEGDIGVEIEEVGYQFVDFISDAMGARGDWPDPIFAQSARGVDCSAGKNQPFWVRVKPARNAKPGLHLGKLKVTAGGVAFDIPLEVEVFDFEMPDRMSCESSFGLAFNRVYAYHHLKTQEEKRIVSEKYLEHFSRHHISPYGPFPMVSDPSWGMSWTKPADPRDAQPKINWKKYDAEVERVLAKYHFNTFIIHLRGIGGGDNSGTHGKPKINGAEQGTELYEIYLSRYLKAVESHLREKGWLKMAYAYVYDEPLKEHVPYANENLSRIAKYAPGIRRMVTVEPREDFGDNVNLWCPITEYFDAAKSRERQAKGDDVWWYITFSSIQPKVNEHIEHSGVDMRVWLWQTWLEKVTGVLIWETVHWTSKKVYPDPEKPQNPYVDTICWGGSGPWNTGEGRYVYPPRACFETKDPVLEGPVDSIRFEMLREGIEDYEYFTLLKKRNPNHPLLAVPREVTTSLTDYSFDPAAMEAHRERLARALEKPLAGDEVSLTETELEMPTYDFSDPNPVPDTASALYPYFRFDGSTATSSPRKWKAVVLENDKIKVTMFPEIGGKVWGAEDKATGRAFVYYNHVVKFRNIALRGPWCSGGIEFNFTITGHAPTSATPVDWCTRRNEDGSVSYFAASQEYIGNTWWQVEVRLAPGDDHFTTRTVWHNSSNLPGAYYQWMNAAFPLDMNSDFVFPGRDAIGHSGFPVAWPVEDGHRLDTYAGNFFGGHKSNHVINGDNALFGIWWPDRKLGAVHRNLSSDKYGRKIWLWSPSRAGAIWEDLLTDSDGQYAELQSGRAFQQPRPPCEETPFKVPGFEPGATDYFVESWGAVHQRGEFADTNQFAKARPVEMPKDFNWNSSAGLTLRAEQKFRYLHDDDGARLLYESALKTDTYFIPALNGLATLEARRGHFERTLALAERALAIDTYDSTANYLAGFAAFEIGDLPTARERLGLATYSPLTKSVAFTLLSRLALRERKCGEALAFAERAIDANRRSPDARHLKVVALRLAGRAVEAKVENDRLLAEVPLFTPARYEEQLLGGKWNYRDFIRGELPNESLQDIAERYAAIGQNEDAEKILSDASASPLAAISRAWLKRDAKKLAAVEKLPIDFAFPFRTSMRPALEWAAKENASWKFKWYLALYLAANGDSDRADRLLADCGESPDDPVFYLYVASRALGAEKRRPLAQAARLSAGTNSKTTRCDWRVDLELAKLEKSAGNHSVQLAAAERALKIKPDSNAAKLTYARALVDMQRYRDCIAFLEKSKILPSEFGENANGIWREACMAIGENEKADSYPENLGAGRPYPQDQRPYEFKQSKRFEDDAKPQEDFEDAPQWQASAKGGEAKVEVSEIEQLFGKRTLCLSYRIDSANDASVEFGPAKPMPLPEKFDTFYVWIKGDRFGAGANRNRSLPVPKLVARFAKSDGSPLQISLGNVTWPDWHQVNHRFTAQELQQLKGGSLVGFALTDGKLPDFRHLHLDDITFFTDDLSAKFEVAPRAKRNLNPLKGAVVGNNTGAGVLPFPTRERTIIPETAAPAPGDLLPAFNGGAVEGADLAALEISQHREGKSLIVDFYAPAGKVTVVSAGTASEAKVLKSFWVPYLAYGRNDKRLKIDLLEGGWYRSAVFDWYRSNASDVDNVNGAFALRYLPKTNGEFNQVSERLVITLSKCFEEVLPVIANPVSPYKARTGTRAWRAHGAFDFKQDAAFWKRIHDAGILHVAINDHETLFRDQGESFTFRTSPAFKRGRNAAAEGYSLYLREELGYLYGPYNNFTDFSPMNGFWKRDLIGRKSDGSFHDAWFRCYGPKPVLVPEYCEKIAPVLAKKYGYNTAYCDVHTALEPYRRTDYDARVPGAATFSQTFYSWGELLLLQKRAWKGPVYSEGGAHFFYSGLSDGNYAQDQDYGFMKNPWIVDFDLKRIHPLECNFGMGSLMMFSPPKTEAQRRDYQPDCDDRERFIDLFMTATAAFGHAPYLILDYCFSSPRPYGMAYQGPGEYDVVAGLPIALRSYAMLQPLAARYTQSEVKTIRYFAADGTLLDTSAAIASGAVARNQIAVEYADGTCVVANGNAAEPLRGSFCGVAIDLPPSAFKGWTKDGTVGAEISCDKAGKRHYRSFSPEFVFEDGRMSKR